ncbi:cilia- and flagella-associated protein 97 isoform X2 [Polypterus senegalus]
MDSPQDLEGEVDHSFFDSDYEDNDQTKQEEEELVNSKFEPSQENRKEATDDNIRKDNVSKKSIEEKPEQSSKGESISIVPEVCISDVNSSKVQAASRSHLQIETVFPTSSSTEERDDEDDEDDYTRSEEDSEEDQQITQYKYKCNNSNSFKKASGKYRHYNAAPAAESGGSSSDSDCHVSELSAKKKSADLPQSSPRHRTKFSLMPRKERYHHTEESEDTVTDVTPLSTPDISPIQSIDLAAVKESLGKKQITKQGNVSRDICEDSEEFCIDEEQERSSVQSLKGSSSSMASSVSLESELVSRHSQKVLSDTKDLNHLLKAFMHLDNSSEKQLTIDCPTQSSRKNFSFSNEEVRRIDRENQRLLRELTRQTAKPKNKNTLSKKPSSPPARMYHSALNRKREQQRIERENMAFLRRLESVKPTVGMKRSEQLTDYQRQMKYMGSPTPSRLEQSSLSRVNTAGKSSRASSAASNVNEWPAPTLPTTVALRASRPPEARAAWS